MKNAASRHFKHVSENWITSADTFEFSEDTGDEVIDFPFPPEVGVAQANLLKVSNNICLFQAKHHYNRDHCGDYFNQGMVEVDFESEALHIETASGGRVIHRERYPQCEVSVGGEATLFRHADRCQFEAILPTIEPVTITTFSLPISSVEKLISHSHTEYLLQSLGIVACPAIVSRDIPLRINSILASALSPQLVGRMKKVYAQAKLLEYLCELIEHLEQEKKPSKKEYRKTKIVNEVYEHLNNLDGKLPSIIELSEQVGMPAQALNRAFKTEFGLTIHRFISKQRLQEAHATVQDSDMPLKKIADRLGYSHANHFITAFKKEFGYPPGSLRR